MTIYFVELEGTNFIKIGYTERPDAAGRIAQLQTGQPGKLRLLGQIPGEMINEYELHQIFAEYRGNGEWFDGPPIFRVFITKMLETKQPWTQCRLYRFHCELVEELQAKINRLEAEPPGWWTKEMGRKHRQLQEKKERIEELEAENLKLKDEVLRVSARITSADAMGMPMQSVGKS
jgi:hypothetical protein